MAAEPNITLRKKPLSQSLEIDDSLDCSQSSDKLGQSLELSTTMYSGCVEEMKSEITTLKANLETTQNEMDNIIIENIDLKNQISQLSHEILILKQICSSPAFLTKKHISSSRKNSVRRRLTDNFSVSPTNQNRSNNSTQPPSPFLGPDETGAQALEKQMADLARQLLEAKSEIMRLNQEINDLERGKNNIMSDSTFQYNNITSREIFQHRKTNLCILTNSNSYGTLQTLEDLIPHHFNYCRHNLPHCSIKRLLQDIDIKLLEYTMNDYCIIMLGEEDIKTTNNYIGLVKTIRESLAHITNTNVVVCTPTYICGALIHNNKIEIFNNLLSLELQSNNYAYFFDSNHNLTLDMFSNNTGRININGIKCIYETILDNIYIDLLNTTIERTNLINGSVQDSSLNFFRE